MFDWYMYVHRSGLKCTKARSPTECGSINLETVNDSKIDNYGYFYSDDSNADEDMVYLN